MDYEALDSSILAVLPKNCKVLSVAQHGSTNWSTGLRVDVQDGGEEKSYFVKVIEREELVGMAVAEYEGQKAIASLIPDNAVIPVAWGYFAETKAKSWFMAEYAHLRDRAPPIEQFLPIVKQLHQKSVSPTGKFGFHVTSFYGPPPMVVDWTDNWEEFWVRELRSVLIYVESMRGQDAELVEISEQFIGKVAARLLRPLQTGGRNIKPSLCHGDLWDGNIQFNPDTQQPVIFDPCCFYGHHEMDFQSMRSPRYTIGRNFIDLYKLKVGASEPSEDFDDRIALYSVRNDLLTGAMWPQWASLVEKAKDDMKLLLEKYPDGLDGFKGSLEPTIARVDEHASNTKESAYHGALADAAIDISSSEQQGVPLHSQSQSAASELEPKHANGVPYGLPDTPPETPSMPQYGFENTDKGNNQDICTPPETPLVAQHLAHGASRDDDDGAETPPELPPSTSATHHESIRDGHSGIYDTLGIFSDIADAKKSYEQRIELVTEPPPKIVHLVDDRLCLPKDEANLAVQSEEDTASVVADPPWSSKDAASATPAIDISGAESPAPEDTICLSGGTLGLTEANVTLLDQMAMPKITKSDEAEPRSSSDVSDGAFSKLSHAEYQGQEPPLTSNMKRSIVDQNVDGPNAEHFTAESVSSEPMSEVSETTSADDPTLYEKLWFLVGKLSVWP